MSSENPHPLHETNAERMERAGGPRRPILFALGWPGLVAAALLGMILVIVTTGLIVYWGASQVFRGHIEQIENDLD